MRLLNKTLIPLFLSILCLITALTFENWNGNYNEKNSNSLSVKEISAITSDFGKKIQQHEKKIISLLNDTLLLHHSTLEHNSLLISQKFKEEKTILNIYINDTLTYWSSNEITLNEKVSDVSEGTNCLLLQNGWYLVVKITRGNIAYIGLTAIKFQYAYQNQFLRNTFNETFYLPSYFNINNDKNKDGHSIKSSNGSYLFTLLLSNEMYEPTPPLLVFVSYILCIVLLFYFIHLSAKKLAVQNKFYWSLLLIASFSAVFRYVTLQYKIPDVIFSLDIFNPANYASSVLLPSLGDLLISAILICWITLFGYIYLPQVAYNKYPNFFRNLSPVLFLMLLQIAELLSLITNGVVINSNLSFDFTNIYTLNHYSYIGLLSVILFTFSFILLSDIIIRKVLLWTRSFKLQLFFYTIAAAVYLLIRLLTSDNIDWYILVLLSIFIISLISIHIHSGRIDSLANLIKIIFVFSLFTGYNLINNIQQKEKEYRKYLAAKLIGDQDAIGEYLFLDIEQKICDDKATYLYLTDTLCSSEELFERLKQLYFTGYFDRYDLKIFAVDSKGNALNKSESNYIDEIIKEIKGNGKITYSDNLFYIKNSSGRITYYGRLPIDKGLEHFGTIFVELKSKFVYYAEGFPELFLDESIQSKKELSDYYSYVVYNNHKAVKQQGYFPYSIDGNEFIFSAKEYTTLNYKNYNHLIYSPNDQITIILSKENISLVNLLTFFSYLFTIFSLFTLIFFASNIYKSFFYKREEGPQQNFSTTVQALILSFFFCLLLIVGIVTFFKLQQQYETYHKERLLRKTRTVLAAAEYETLRQHQDNIQNKEDLSMLVNKLSSIHSIDMNIYNLNGKLLATSQPKIYNKGLIAKLITPEALYELQKNKKTYLTRDESIGKLEYSTAYVPMRNESNNTAAYMSLPYFAKQMDLKEDMSLMFATLINISVFVFVLISFFSLFLYKPFTAPLELLREKFRKTRLGQHNEPIRWNSKDEIGGLVQEYNKMLLELEKSAELLAKSERETAWREMAKQVAHEIKNPLTPMKLSIQQLERAWNDKSSDLDDRIRKLTHTLIQQIDNLSVIASEFSSFAKMPPAQNEILKVEEVIISSINLFKQNENIEITLVKNINDEMFVIADKDQMLSVFNNLIKNSIQAIPKNKKGLINISLSRNNEKILIKVQDNGSGIDNKMKDKIFEPNFTTKSSGMGLGLSIVKNIIEIAMGEIWFETNYEKGTCFYISLPSAKSDNT